MRYRTLGRTGLSVSVVGVGTWQFGDEWGKTFAQDEVDAMFRAAEDEGINLVDTAECYGDHLSERLVGRALRGVRDRWVVATKFGHHFVEPFKRTEPRSPADVVAQLEASLAALETDRVDLWQYHSWGDEQFFDDDVLAAVHKCRDQGKVRHIGNSVGSNTNVKQVAASEARGIEAIQIIYNRLDRGPEETAFPVCIEQKLGVLARVPLASGYLSGKYAPGHRFDKNEVRGKWQNEEKTRAALEEVARIRDSELPAGVPMAEWALAWCLRHPAVTCVIPGCKDVAQVRSNARAAGLAGVADDHPLAAAQPA